MIIQTKAWLAGWRAWAWMAMVAAVLVPWGAEAGEATRQGVKLMDGVVATAAVMAAWALAGGRRRGEKRVRVTWMDAAVAGLLAWEAAGMAWAWETVDREVVWRWAGTGMVYAAARACGWRGERWGWWTLLAAWAAQAGFGLAEATEGFRHWREWKGMTGSMGNSGIWSGFTACAGVAAWVCLAGSRRGWERGLAGVMVAATAVALVAGDSRAAWLGYAAGCAGLIPRERMGKWRMVAIGAVAAAAVGIVVMVGARPERGASAEGRLLVWRVASEIWADHPWGRGADGFRRMYGRQQGDYLQRQGTERERMLADETREAFNEWARRGVEGGIAGVLLAGARGAPSGRGWCSGCSRTRGAFSSARPRWRCCWPPGRARAEAGGMSQWDGGRGWARWQERWRWRGCICLTGRRSPRGRVA